MVSGLARLATADGLALAELPLADVVRGYRARLQLVNPVDLDEAGEFIALVSRLMLQKSAWLLAEPSGSVDEEPVETGPAWLQPVELSELAGRVRLSEGRESLAPPAIVPSIEPRTEPRSPSLLQRAWRDIASRRTDESVPVPVPAFVRLESAVSSLIRRLKSSARLPFRKLIRGANRTEAVIQFLAVLELVRRRTAHVQQDDVFADMIIEYREGDTERAARAG